MQFVVPLYVSLPARSFYSYSWSWWGRKIKNNLQNIAACDRKEAMAAIMSQPVRLLVLALVALNVFLVAEVRGNKTKVIPRLWFLVLGLKLCVTYA